MLRHTEFRLRLLDVALIGPGVLGWFTRIPHDPPFAGQLVARYGGASHGQLENWSNIFRKIHVRAKRLGFHTIPAPVVFARRIAVPLHYSRKLSPSGPRRCRPSLQHNRLARGSPRQAVIGYATLFVTDALGKRKEIRVLQGSFSRRGICK